MSGAIHNGQTTNSLARANVASIHGQTLHHMSNALTLCLPNAESSNTMTDQASATLPDPAEVPRTRRRRRTRPIEDLTLTEAQVQEGEQEAARLDKKKCLC